MTTPAHLTPDVLVDQHILALVVKDDMNLLGARTADVWTYTSSKHKLLTKAGSSPLCERKI